jgi:hypothetical protein
LWGVTQVLYSDYARSVETAAAVRTELNQAKTALKEGNPERARASLQRVQKQLPVIGEAEGRTDLTARHRELEQMLNGSSDAGVANVPRLPMFPLPGAPYTKHQPSKPPKSDESPAEPNTTSNSIPELPSDMTARQPNRIAPNREYPGHRYDSAGQGIPGPDGGASDSGPSSRGLPGRRDLPGRGPTGSGTPGKDLSGGTSIDSDNTNGDGSSNGDSVRSDWPKKGHVSSNPPNNEDAPLGCHSVGPRPPYCG